MSVIPTMAQLIALRRVKSRKLADVIEEWNERAAIREYEGGQSRSDAENAALNDIA